MAAARTESERIVALESAYDHVATKVDIANLRAELKADIEKIKADLTWRIVIAMSILTGIIVAVIKLPVTSG